MVFDIPNESPERLERFKGGELYLSAKTHDDGMNKLLHGTLPAGASIGLHSHDDGSEIIYILSGRGHVLYDGELLPVSEGQCHYCPKGHSHSLINDSENELVFFAVIPKQ